MTDFILFGTEACHLCEEAEALVQALGLSCKTQDIIEDLQLQQRYGLRIPVLWHAASSAELSWPFDADGLRQFIEQARALR